MPWRKSGIWSWNDRATFDDSAFRALGALVRTVADLGELLEPPIVDRVADELVAAVLREDESWRGDEAGRWIQHLARRGGPLWEEVLARLKPKLARKPVRGRVLRAKLATLPEAEACVLYDWSRAWFEEDPLVRTAAIEHCRHHPATPHLVKTMVYSLFDVGYAWFHGTSPAIAAGAGLRDVSHERDQIVSVARQQLSSGSQLSAGAAAVALRPGEAPTDELLHALQFLADFRVTPEMIVAIDALRDTPEGAAWLETHWPRAAAGLSAVPEQPVDPHALEGELPPSELVHDRLIKAVGPGFLAPDAWASLPPGIRWRSTFLRTLCDAHAARPTSLAPLFLKMIEESAHKPYPHPWPRAVQRACAAAAVHESRLVVELLRWAKELPKSAISAFPAIALEDLVQDDDEDASQGYAAWLERTYEVGLGGYQVPVSILAHGRIRRAAMNVIEGAWQYATVGRVRDGERTYLSAGTLSGVLYGLWPLWADEKYILDGLIERGQGETDLWQEAAWTAFPVDALPEELKCSLVRSLTDRNTPMMSHTLVKRIALAREVGVCDRMVDALGSLAAEPHPCALMAAVALCDVVNVAERRGLSRRAAERFPMGCMTEGISKPDLAAFVSEAPDTWLNALRNISTEAAFMAAPCLWLAEALLASGADGVRVPVLNTLRTLQKWRLPRNIQLGRRAVSVGDAASELLYFGPRPLS